MDEDNSSELPAALLNVAAQLAHELHPQRKHMIRLNLDSALHKDFDFDSLARVELLHRLERSFSVSLSEQVLAEAESPRDLLRAVQEYQAAQPQRSAPQMRPIDLGDVESTPLESQTVVEMLAWHVENHPDYLSLPKTQSMTRFLLWDSAGSTNLGGLVQLGYNVAG